MSRRANGVQLRRVRCHHRRETRSKPCATSSGSDPRPFLDAARRDWQFAAFAWLLRGSGGYPKFLDTALVLPTEQFFPDRAMSGHAGVAALFRRVRDHAGMADWPCNVEPDEKAERPWLSGARPHADDPLPAGRARAHVAGCRVRARDGALLRRNLRRAARPVARRLHGAGAGLRRGVHGIRRLHGELGARRRQPRAQRGRAGARARHVLHPAALPPESIDAHVNPHLRKYLRLAARDLAQHDSGFQQLRSVFPVVPIEDSRKG